MQLKILPLTILLGVMLLSFASTVGAASNVEEMGNKLLQKLEVYNEEIENGDLNEIDSLYDGLTSEIQQVEKAIGQVSGANNRKRLNERFITPSKIAVERTIYEISQLRLMEDIKVLVDSANIDRIYESGNLDKAISETAKLERLKRRTVEIKAAGGYEDLPVAIHRELRRIEAETQGGLMLRLLEQYNSSINDGNIFEVDYLYNRFTTELEKTEKKIGQVYGASTRGRLNDQYVTASKVAVERTIYEVTQVRLLNDISDMIRKGQLDSLNQTFNLLDRVERRGKEIKEAGGYQSLPSQINNELESREQLLRVSVEQKPINNERLRDPEFMDYASKGQVKGIDVIAGETFLNDVLTMWGEPDARGEREGGFELLFQDCSCGITAGYLPETGKRISSIELEIDMTTDEIESLFGEPDSSDFVEYFDTFYMTYNFDDYVVSFENEGIDSYVTNVQISPRK